MTYEDFGQYAGYFGSLLILDGVGLHALTCAATSAGRKVVTTIAELIESSNAPHHMVEVAGIGKIAVEEGMGAAYKALESVAESSSIIKNNHKPVLPGTTGLNIFINNGLKSIGNNIWKSTGGLIFGPDPKYGNRFLHVLEHFKPLKANSLKDQHTLFSIPQNKIVELLDEAWKLKGSTVPGKPMVYIVNMKRVIGTAGERNIKIVVKAGTANIVTAFPVSYPVI
jgi:hypothetical protein